MDIFYIRYDIISTLNRYFTFLQICNVPKHISPIAIFFLSCSKLLYRYRFMTDFGPFWKRNIDYLWHQVELNNHSPGTVTRSARKVWPKESLYKNIVHKEQVHLNKKLVRWFVGTATGIIKTVSEFCKTNWEFFTTLDLLS